MKIGPGQRAVVTGACSGIGLALAHELAGRGMDVCMADVEENGPAVDGVAALAAGRAAVCFSRVDVSDPISMATLADSVMSDFGGVDLLCNNAGVVGPRLPLWEQGIDDVRWVLDVNLWGVIHGIRAFLPAMVDANRGHVLNTASIAALSVVAAGGNGPYAASKHAVAGLSEVLREELRVAAPQVGVTVLCPGPVDTRIREAARNRPVGADGARAEGPAAARTAVTFEHAVGTISPVDAARAAVEAVEDGRFWALTNPGNEGEVVERLRRIERDITR